MAHFRSTALFPILVVTLFAIGGVELGYYCLEVFVLDTAPEHRRQVVQQPAPRSQLAEGEQQVEVMDYAIITRRNLFGPPPSPGESAPVQVEEELEATTLDIVLMGTVDTDGDAGRAIILKKKDRSQDIYQVGDLVEGASVKEIQRGRVILSVDGRNELLDISEARQYASSTTPVPTRSAALRRTPVVRPEPTAQQQAPRVVRPLRRIVRPQAAIAADQAERENLELIEDNSQVPDDGTESGRVEPEEQEETEGVAEEPVEDEETGEISDQEGEDLLTQ